MHFPVRSNAIPVIITTYDAKTKGAKSQVLGRIDRRTLGPTEQLRSACRDEEPKEVNAWIEQCRRTEAIKIEAAARTFGSQIGIASGWFNNANAHGTRLVAGHLLPVLNKLRARLRRQNPID